MRFAFAPLAVAAASLLACTGAADVTPPPVADPPPPAAEGAWLVWELAPDGVHTAWIDANGAEVARADALVFAAGSRVWRVQQQKVPTKGLDCACAQEKDPDFQGAPVECETDEETEIVTLVDLQTPDVRAAIVPPVPPEKARQDYESSPGIGASIVAQVGPYLMVETSGYAFGCGAAHGSGWVKFDVYDASLPTPTPVPMVADAEKAALLGSDAARALANEVAAGGDVFDAAQYELTKVTPRWQADGTLATEAQLTWGACYACSDGNWSAYTRSGALPLPVPGQYGPYATAPAPVKAWWAAHPNHGPGGWSEVPAAQAGALDAFRR